MHNSIRCYILRESLHVLVMGRVIGLSTEEEECYNIIIDEILDEIIEEIKTLMSRGRTFQDITLTMLLIGPSLRVHLFSY